MEKFRRKRNEVRSAIRRSRKEYETRVLERAVDKPKVLFGYINSTLKNKETILVSKGENSEDIIENDAKAEHLSRFFVSVFTDETDFDEAGLPAGTTNEIIENIDFTEEDVRRELLALKEVRSRIGLTGHLRINCTSQTAPNVVPTSATSPSSPPPTNTDYTSEPPLLSSFSSSSTSPVSSSFSSSSCTSSSSYSSSSTATTSVSRDCLSSEPALFLPFLPGHNTTPATDSTGCSGAPIFDQKIRFLKVSSTVCVPGKPVEKNLNAIVIVKSAVYNFADRDRLRRAFAKEKQREPEFRMAMIFSVGLPRSSGGRFFQRDGFNISLPDRAGKAIEAMQTKRTEVLRNLTEEARVNGDLVLGDYEDTYYNLSLKLFHTYQWASSFCRPQFTSQQRPPVFIFLDDDFAFNASRMKAELGALTDAQIRRVTWGLPRNQSPTNRHLRSTRNEKWSVSKREIPWPYYPHLAPGCFNVIGADVLQEIALAMYFTLQFPLDDAWLGMVMTKLDLQFQFRPHMYNKWPKNVKNESVLFAPLDYFFSSH
ncbi:hypothetical protein SprV_0702373200 [Sparganum proliferum]